MANVHRALAALGQGLGDMVNLEAGRERDRVMALRQENLMRIDHSLNEQSRSADRTFDAGERAKDREANLGVQISQVEQANLDRKASATQHHESLAVQREGNQLQADQLALQNRRYDEGQYVEQANRIDKRMQELNDYLTQATAEGKVMDEAALAPLKQEMTQLQEARQSLAQERDITLARSGDSRYRKLSKEEVAKLKPAQQPPAAPKTPTVAAQAPQGSTTKPVPSAPAKPPGMQVREERANRKVAGKDYAPDNARAADAASATRAGKLREQLAGKSRLDLELQLRTESDRDIKAAIRERLAEINRTSTRDLMPST